MSLFNFWNNKVNMVVRQSLQCNMSCTYAAKASSARTTMYEYTRKITKRYAYVGMNMATARACAEAKIKKYTHTWMRTNYDSSGHSYNYLDTKCDASVSMSNAGGDMWDVEVEVDSVDTVNWFSFFSDPSGLFSWYTDYDEEEETGTFLMIDSLDTTTRKLFYSCDNMGSGWTYTDTRLKVQKSSDGLTWTDCTVPASYRNEGYLYLPQESYSAYYRLVWTGAAPSVTSNVYLAADAISYSDTITLADAKMDYANNVTFTMTADFKDFVPSAAIYEWLDEFGVTWSKFEPTVNKKYTSPLDRRYLVITGHEGNLNRGYRVTYANYTSNTIYSPYDPMSDITENNSPWHTLGSFSADGKTIAYFDEGNADTVWANWFDEDNHIWSQQQVTSTLHTIGEDTYRTITLDNLAGKAWCVYLSDGLLNGSRSKPIRQFTTPTAMSDKLKIIYVDGNQPAGGTGRGGSIFRPVIALQIPNAQSGVVPTLASFKMSQDGGATWADVAHGVDPINYATGLFAVMPESDIVTDPDTGTDTIIRIGYRDEVVTYKLPAEAYNDSQT